MAGRNRKVLYIASKKAGHNEEISSKNGILMKVNSSEELKKRDVPPKTGQLACMELKIPIKSTRHMERSHAPVIWEVLV